MDIVDIRNLSHIEEIDYPFLMSCLKGYKQPRAKISQLLRSKALIRVKKGLYIFGPKYRKGPICLELLANLIYGPSYVSKEYALAYYGLIPERVSRITSMAWGRSRVFDTPLALFSYYHLNETAYAVDIELVSIDPLHQVLMATPEKALVDTIASLPPFETSDDLLCHLTESLRMDESQLTRMNQFRLLHSCKAYQQRGALKQLVDLLDKKL